MCSIGAFWAVTVACVFLTGSVQGQTKELTYTIEEERPAMTFIGNVLDDSNLRQQVSASSISDLRFSFLSQGNPQASLMWINTTNGDLKTSVRINRETLCPKILLCELRVQTVVQALMGSFFQIIQLKITIEDINDNAPTFTPALFLAKISEAEIPGYSFQLPSATDPDVGIGSGVAVYILKPTSAPFTLTINGSSSSVSVRMQLDASLDRETTPSYELLVLALDSGSPKMTGTLTVRVEVVDVNDNSPVFEKKTYLANISDSTPLESMVLVVSATDADTGDNGRVSYSLAAVQEDPLVFRMFSINVTTGQILTKVSMDSYAGRAYRLAVEAQDAGAMPRTGRTDVIITVLDIHNSQPEILLNVFGVAGLAKVSELAELGRVVAHVAVSDPDSSLSPNGQVFCYLQNSEEFRLQAMEQKQYKVILAKRLDREQQSIHTVSVICEDSGNPPLTATSNFTVEVEDDNDNPPVFDPVFYTADVTEGPVGSTGGRDANSFVLRVHATDRDTGQNALITYRLAEGSDSDFGIFQDGSIMVTNPAGVDREDKVKGSVRRITVLAVDNGKTQLTGSATVVVTIRDMNDNPPRFTEPMYFFSVMENVPLDYVINTVSATDADLESNALFYFEMHRRDLNVVPFQVTRSGAISVAGSIDRENKVNYEFRVVAYDLGEPLRLSSTVTVNVKVLDVNDNSPEFLFPNEDNFTISIPHTLSENTAFANVIAIDRDEGLNGQLLFARDSGNGSKFFDVEANSGQIVLIRPLTIRDVGLHVLVIVGHDRGLQVQLASQSVLHIVVYEGNGTLPLISDPVGFRNMVVVAVLVVVTIVLALAILLTIVLIRRVDRQRRQYTAKSQEFKSDPHIRHMNLCSVAGVEHSSPKLSDLVGGDAKDGSKKKKEVSFSLEEENSANPAPTMTTFSPAVVDKYDAISDHDRGKMKNDALSSNHYQKDQHQVKISGSKKDIHNFNYHLVIPGGQKHRQVSETSGQHDDNTSNSSGDSTSDSGRGGSDVELHNHVGGTKESGDTSFVSRRGSEERNNLNTNPSKTHSQNLNLNSSNNHGGAKPQAKSVHFQNIRPDAISLSSLVSLSPPSTFTSPRTPRSPTPCSPTPRSPILPGVCPPKHFPRYTLPSGVPESNNGFLNYPTGASGRSSNPSNKELEYYRNRMISDGFLPGQSSRQRVGVSSTGAGYTDMSRNRQSVSPVSNSCMDGTEGWDGDTTTSGSYTVDPQEMCEEIDKLFFNEVHDVVV